jgi:hypothetical protein
MQQHAGCIRSSAAGQDEGVVHQVWGPVHVLQQQQQQWQQQQWQQQQSGWQQTGLNSCHNLFRNQIHGGYVAYYRTSKCCCLA